MRINILFSTYLLVFFLVLIGCTGSSNQSSASTDKTFTYNQASSVTTLDPAFAKDQATTWIANQLFDGLVRLDEKLRVEPALAKSWTISPNGQVYVFNLRTDVFFHENTCFKDKKRKLKAQDVVYSLSRILDTQVASPGAWLFLDKVAKKNPFTAINDSTFQLALSKPFRPILEILSMQYFSIVAKEAVEFYGNNFRTNPVGTGPFAAKKWIEGNVLILEKNKHYFMVDTKGYRLPYLDRVRVLFIDNKKTAFLSFLKGEIDFISGIDPSYTQDALTKNGQLNPTLEKHIYLLKSPYLNTEYLGFQMKEKNTKLNEIQKKALRKAINYGFDRKEMLLYLRNNIGIPASAGFVPPGLPSFSPEVRGYTYDVEKAKHLLSQAGLHKGNMPSIELYTTSNYQDLCAYIASQLGQIGIPIQVNLKQSGLLREMIQSGKAAFFRGSWIADYPDAESFLAVFYSPYGVPPNYTRFENKTYNQLYEKILIEQNDKKRYAMYHQMERILIEQAPIVPLYYDQILRFIKKGITGLEPNAMNMLDLRRVNKKEIQ